VDAVALRVSVSGPLYDSGMLATPLGTPKYGSACAAIGMNSNPSPANAKSALLIIIFIFTRVSPL